LRLACVYQAVNRDLNNELAKPVCNLLINIDADLICVYLQHYAVCNEASEEADVMHAKSLQ
jgi:hypothetical protein